MNRPGNSASQALRRSAMAIGIVAAHVALIMVLAYNPLKARVAEPAPVVVTFLQDHQPQPFAPAFHDPVLEPVRTVVTVAPDIEVPEPVDTAITAVVSEPSPPTPPAGPQTPKGADIPAMSEIAYLEQPSPRYPPESRRAREEGLVVLRVLVDERGHVRNVDIYRSSGHPRLDEAARSAVAHALFKPYLDGGVARAASATIPIEFSLHRSS